MKVALLTLGCKLNFAETATYERGFLAAGLEVVPWGQAADVCLTMVDGRVLYEDGTFYTLDRERILFEARRAAARLMG